MTSAETCHYRGYDILPKRQWSRTFIWCVGIYPTNKDLPLLPQSTLDTLTPRREDALAEAKQTIDRILSRR
jgi:hypothetical protein